MIDIDGIVKVYDIKKVVQYDDTILVIADTNEDIETRQRKLNEFVSEDFDGTLMILNSAELVEAEKYGSPLMSAMNFGFILYSKEGQRV